MANRWASLVKAFSTADVEYEMNGNGAEPEIEQKALIMEPAIFWSNGVIEGTRVEESVTRFTAYAMALAYICINKRRNKLCEAPPMVVDETASGEPWIETHSLNPLLAKPNPDQTFRQLYERTSVYRDLTGRALWVKVKNRGRETAELRAFAGNQFRVERTRFRENGRFLVTTQEGEQTYLPEDVIYFAGLDPWDPQGAVAPIDAVMGELGIGGALKTATKKTLENALMPGGVITLPDTPQEAEFTRIKGMLDQTYAGAKRAGKPMLLPGGATWQNVALTLTEMLPEHVIAYVEATVCAAFELHPSVLGLKTGVENAPWSNLEQAQRMMYDEMCMPRWVADAEILTEQLLRDVDDDANHLIQFDTSEIGVLQEDIAEKAEILKTVGPYLSYDEAREVMGYKAIGGELGKTHFVPMTWVPADIVATGGIDMTKPTNRTEDGEEGEPDAAPDDEAPEEE